MQAILSPSDLVHGVLIAHLVFSSRDKSNQLWNPMMALCYFCEAIDSPKSRQYASFAQLSAWFDNVVRVENGLEDVWQSLLRIDTVDDFSLLIESMRNALLPNASINFNDLNGPSTITADSKLGIYLRSILVQWECLQFDDICDLFRKMQLFLADSRTDITSKPTSTGGMNTPYRLFQHKDTSTSQISSDSEYTELKFDAVSLQNAACDSLLKGDVADAEKLLHSLFDQNSTDPLRCALRPLPDTKIPDSPEKSSETGIMRTLLQMLHSDETTRASATKHQHAMLSLARMWLHADNYPMALSAIEEALKTAHQRGDHAAVAQSLFLLHAVFQNSNDPSLVASVEDILLRCTKRSAALDLQSLTAQSALLLVQLRAKQPFRENNLIASENSPAGSSAPSGAHASISNDNTNSNTTGPTETSIWQVADLWSQMSFALLGEIALTRQVVSLAGITEDTEFTQSGPTNAMMGPNAAANAKKENLQEVPLSVSPELVKLSLQASLISSDLYARLGMLQMSEFVCLRAVKQFASVASVEDMLAVYMKLLQVQVQLVALGPGAVPSSSSPSAPATSAATEIYTQLKRLSKQIRASLPSTLPFALSQQWESVDVLIAVRAAQASGDISKALRLAHRLVELTAAGPMEKETSLSDAHLEARVLLAEIVAHFDLSASLQLLEEVAAGCKKNDNLAMHSLCMLRKAQFTLQYASHDEEASRNAMLSMENTLSTARKSGLGLLEVYIAQFSTCYCFPN